MSQEPSALALVYLKERNGYPTEYRHQLMDGVQQGRAFLMGLTSRHRDSVPPGMVGRLNGISSISALDLTIQELLDYEANMIKETQNG